MKNSNPDKDHSEQALVQHEPDNASERLKVNSDSPRHDDFTSNHEGSADPGVQKPKAGPDVKGVSGVRPAGDPDYPNFLWGDDEVVQFYFGGAVKESGPGTGSSKAEGKDSAQNHLKGLAKGFQGVRAKTFGEKVHPANNYDDPGFGIQDDDQKDSELQRIIGRLKQKKNLVNYYMNGFNNTFSFKPPSKRFDNFHFQNNYMGQSPLYQTNYSSREDCKDRFFKCFMVSVVILFYLFFILAAYFGYTIAFIIDDPSESSGVANYVIYSVGNAPIIDVQMLDQDDNDDCPTGYELVVLGYWPGTNTDCKSTVESKLGSWWDTDSPPDRLLFQENSGLNQLNISSENDLRYLRSRSSFSSSRTRTNNDGCPTIDAQEPHTIDLWGDYMVCVNRASSYQYTTSGACSGSMKLCSPDVCIPESEQCPITDITLVSSVDEDAEEDTTYTTYGSQFLELRRRGDASKAALMEYSINGLPCLSSPSRWQKREAPKYPLLPDGLYGYECSYGVDENSQIIEEMDEYDLYKSNGMKSKVEDSTGYYNVIKDQEAALVMRPRVELNDIDACLQVDLTGITGTESLPVLHADVKKWHPENLALAILETIFGSIMVIIVVLKVFFDKNNDRGCINCSFFACSMLTVLSILACFILNCVIFASLDGNISKVTDLNFDNLFRMNQMNCFSNPSVSQAITDYEGLNNRYQDAQGLLAGSLVSTVLQFVFIIVSLILIFKNK